WRGRAAIAGWIAEAAGRARVHRSRRGRGTRARAGAGGEPGSPRRGRRRPGRRSGEPGFEAALRPPAEVLAAPARGPRQGQPLDRDVPRGSRSRAGATRIRPGEPHGPSAGSDGGHGRRDPAPGPRPADVLERTVRTSARATDEVSVDRRGRVRVILHGTG